MTVTMNARRRMARLLSSDAAQYRISKLSRDPGAFSADVIDAFSANEDVARLDETEVFAVCELAERLRLCFGPGKEAFLAAHNGRCVLSVGFSALHRLSKLVMEPADG